MLFRSLADPVHGENVLGHGGTVRWRDPQGSKDQLGLWMIAKTRTQHHDQPPPRPWTDGKRPPLDPRKSSLGCQLEFTLSRGTLAQIQTDEALVGDACFLCDAFQVTDAIFIQSDRDALIELGGVRILTGLGKIVFFSHGSSQGQEVCPHAVGFRAKRAEYVLTLKPLWGRPNRAIKYSASHFSFSRPPSKT